MKLQRIPPTSDKLLISWRYVSRDQKSSIASEFIRIVDALFTPHPPVCFLEDVLDVHQFTALESKLITRRRAVVPEGNENLVVFEFLCTDILSHTHKHACKQTHTRTHARTHACKQTIPITLLIPAHKDEMNNVAVNWTAYVVQETTSI